MAHFVYTGLKANLPEVRENAFYLCTDTREIYFGADLFTEAVRTYTGEKSATPATGVLYVNTDTKVGEIWTGSAWVQLFGGSSTDDIVFTEDLVFTYQFGKYTPVGGKVTVPAKDKTLTELLNDAFAEDQNPTVTQPSVTLTAAKIKAYEVGTKVSPDYSAVLNPGSYEFEPKATGIVASAWKVTNTDGGEKTAKSYYGTRGWTTSVSSNIFGFTSPLASEDMSWNFSPFAGPWLATHLWDYYDYTRDKKFLSDTAYDIIKGSANFATDYLWHRKDGVYTAAPSTSPEHGPIDEGATFAHAVIREILLDAVEASKILGRDAKDRKQWEDALKHIAPYQIGRYGQLMEWSKDIDDPKDEHRHVNHLFGLHPGRTISPITTPVLAKASKVVLEHRGDGATGWSMGWKLNQWARLHDGNHAYKLYGNLLKNGTLDNLWDTHAPFQIDGNFGGTAGVTEMLMQSHMGFIHLLPALPDAWQKGSIKGLRAKGNFTVDIYWDNGRLTKAVILSGSGEPCQVRYGDKVKKMKTQKGKTYEVKF